MTDESFDDGIRFEAGSIYGARTRRGLVEIGVGTLDFVVTPSKAREMATILLEAASSAEGDETLIAALERTGFATNRIQWVLMASREARRVLEARARREARAAIAFDQDDPDRRA